MDYNSLSRSVIEEALSFCNEDDTSFWLKAASILKHEFGYQEGFEMWMAFSARGSSFNRKHAEYTYKKAKIMSKLSIGTIIYEARNDGFRLDKGRIQEVSPHVRKEKEKRKAIEKEKAIAAEIQKEKDYQKKAQDAQGYFLSLPECEGQNHPYLVKKDIMAHGCRLGDWKYRGENGEMLVEKNALILPLYDGQKIMTVQAIFADGTKKIKYGAKKEGAYFVIGEETQTILLCEGFATGATLHEASQLMTVVAVDAGNLENVAPKIRKMYPLARIIICADNDQYKRKNTGLLVAQKIACEVDAEIIYPIFKDISTRPTDFNDLYQQEGYSPIIDMIQAVPNGYKPVENGAMVLSSWDLEWIDNAEKVLEESNSEIDCARAGLYVALRMGEKVPAFLTLDAIRQKLKHPLINPRTVTSIMKRVQWSMFSRKRLAMSAIKPEIWDAKHDFLFVDSLENLDVSTPVVLVSAPMGAGKTKNVIKPLSEKSDSFVAIAHRRSLIKDLSARLGVKSYEDIKSQELAFLQDKIAICLPSTQSMVFKPFIDRVTTVAIDEISQNIRFTSSKECKVAGANQDSIFTGLKDLVNGAEKVIACDASIDQTTLSFFEQARPDERFTIVQQAPVNKGRIAYLYDERADFLSKISIELQSGGKVWLAVESAEKAEVLNTIFGEQYKTMIITSKNSKTKLVKEFLENVEDKSRDYDLVIASPAISSGVSVEHHGAPHFTMIAGMASGHSICFSDFAQMLGRVRYVKDYHIFLTPNNLRNEQVNSQSVINGLKQASMIEGSAHLENSYTEFKAQIDTTEDIFRADFANGLVWFLEYFCFEVTAGKSPSPDYAMSELMKQISAENRERHRTMIKTARKITREEADDMGGSNNLSEEDSYALLAFKLRASFRFNIAHEIDDTDLDMFESMAKVDRFARFMGLTHDNDDSQVNIALRKFEKAQVVASKIIFNGFNFDMITAKDCDDMIARVAKNENRFLLTALKLIPSCYGKWQEDKKGALKSYPIPKSAGKAVGAILDKFGLEWSRTRGVGGENYHRVKPESLERMKFYAQSRYS